MLFYTMLPIGSVYGSHSMVFSRFLRKQKGKVFIHTVASIFAFVPATLHATFDQNLVGYSAEVAAFSQIPMMLSFQLSYR